MCDVCKAAAVAVGVWLGDMVSKMFRPTLFRKNINFLSLSDQTSLNLPYNMR